MYPTFQCSEEHFIYCGNPSELELAYEDIIFTSSDGIKLSAWYIPAENSERALLFIHGHGADRHEGMRWFKAVHKAGFNIFAIDLRNSGKSEKSFSSMSFHERLDAISAVDYLQQNKKINDIGIFGVSMGGATSIAAMAGDPRIRAGVFEASWANMRDLHKGIIEQGFGIPSFPILPLTYLMLKLRTGIDFEQINPEDVIGNIATRPTFVIHCTGDQLIPFSHGERNFAAAKEPKEFWASSCQHHARAWQSDPEYIEKRVVEYFDKHL